MATAKLRQQMWVIAAPARLLIERVTAPRVTAA